MHPRLHISAASPYPRFFILTTWQYIAYRIIEHQTDARMQPCRNDFNPHHAHVKVTFLKKIIKNVNNCTALFRKQRNIWLEKQNWQQSQEYQFVLLVCKIDNVTERFRHPSLNGAGKKIKLIDMNLSKKKKNLIDMWLIKTYPDNLS